MKLVGDLGEEEVTKEVEAEEVMEPMEEVMDEEV